MMTSLAEHSLVKKNSLQGDEQLGNHGTYWTIREQWTVIKSMCLYVSNKFVSDFLKKCVHWNNFLWMWEIWKTICMETIDDCTISCIETILCGILDNWPSAEKKLFISKKAALSESLKNLGLWNTACSLSLAQYLRLRSPVRLPLFSPAQDLDFARNLRRSSEKSLCSICV